MFNKHILFLVLLSLFSSSTFGNPLLLTSESKRTKRLESKVLDLKQIWRNILLIHLNAQSYVKSYRAFIQGDINVNTFDPIAGHKSCDVTSLISILESKELGHSKSINDVDEIFHRRTVRLIKTRVDPIDEVDAAEKLISLTKEFLEELIELDFYQTASRKKLEDFLRKLLIDKYSIQTMEGIQARRKQLEEKFFTHKNLGDLLDHLGIGDQQYGATFTKSSLILLRDYLLTISNDLKGKDQTPYPSRQKLSILRKFEYHKSIPIDEKKFPLTLAPTFLDREIIRISQDEIVERDYQAVYQLIQGTILQDIADVFNQSTVNSVREKSKRHIKWVSMKAVFKKIAEYKIPIALVIHDTIKGKNPYDLTRPYDHILYGPLEEDHHGHYINLEGKVNESLLNPNEEILIVHMRRPQYIGKDLNRPIDEYLMENNISIFDLILYDVASYEFEEWSHNFVSELNRQYNLQLEIVRDSDSKAKIIDEAQEDLKAKVREMVDHFNNEIAPLQHLARKYGLCRNPHDESGHHKDFQTDNVNGNILHLSPGRIGDFPFVRNTIPELNIVLSPKEMDPMKELRLKQNVEKLTLDLSNYYGHKKGEIDERYIWCTLGDLKLDYLRELKLIVPPFEGGHSKENISGFLSFMLLQKFERLEKVEFILPEDLMNISIGVYQFIQNNPKVKTLSLTLANPQPDSPPIDLTLIEKLEVENIFINGERFIHKNGLKKQ